MSTLDNRPATTEHAPFALTYVEATTNALKATSASGVIALLERQVGDLRALLAGVSETVARQSYAPGKWTLAESLLHVADTERVFAYRALRVSRGDQTPLPGFDQDPWVPLSGASSRTLADILTEIEAVRIANLHMIRAFDDAAVARTGIASGNPVSVRALVWVISGHFAHHLELTRTKYLGRP